MQKEWISLRITLVLYLLVLLIPVSFYLVSNSIQTITEDTKAIRQSSWLAGTAAYIAQNPDMTNSDKKLIINVVDKALGQISVWVENNSASKFYISDQTLQKDFEQVEGCWEDYRTLLSQTDDLTEKANECYVVSDKMALIIEKMSYLKQNRMINLFYVGLALAMLLMILGIYFVRVFIRHQLRKHSIHDHETHLFNKKYLLSITQKLTAESVRHDDPLSILWLSMQFEENTSKPKKLQLLKEFGKVVQETIRTSDTAARYDDPSADFNENLFAILLPMSSEKNGMVLQERLQKLLKEDKMMNASKVVFHFTIGEFDRNEEYEVFVARTKSALKEG
jgi:GGDEF domain-containing protein